MSEKLLSELEQSPIIERLTKDLKAAATTLTNDEARYLVDTYYQVQDFRLRFANQIRAQEKIKEPHTTLTWFFNHMESLEKRILQALDAYAKSKDLGKRVMTVCGIGPVLTAGLLAHVEFGPGRADTFGALQRFAGIDPTIVWEKGKKRPFNADLKRLTYLIGESFVKVQNNDNDFYGKIYRKRKDLEMFRNEQLQFKDQAEEKLKKFKIGKDTEAYKSYSIGKLPPAHIHARARRYAVRLFLAHYFEVGYELTTGEKPPVPYAISNLGHAPTSYIAPPF